MTSFPEIYNNGKATIADGKITFSYLNSAGGAETKTMPLLDVDGIVKKVTDRRERFGKAKPPGSTRESELGRFERKYVSAHPEKLLRQAFAKMDEDHKGEMVQMLAGYSHAGISDPDWLKENASKSSQVLGDDSKPLSIKKKAPDAGWRNNPTYGTKTEWTRVIPVKDQIGPPVSDNNDRKAMLAVRRQWNPKNKPGDRNALYVNTDKRPARKMPPGDGTNKTPKAMTKMTHLYHNAMSVCVRKLSDKRKKLENELQAKLKESEHKMKPAFGARLHPARRPHQVIAGMPLGMVAGGPRSRFAEPTYKMHNQLCKDWSAWNAMRGKMGGGSRIKNDTKESNWKLPKPGEGKGDHELGRAWGRALSGKSKD